MKKANRLIQEASPYLLQHAYNPVDWYSWGDEAFNKAREENKPVFLSIGYSTCHWCHVMEKESFEAPDAAKLLNEVFVSIKVDREERPDIDAIYMSVCQMMNGSGGWPLTIFMTPDKKPFFAGTYFPKLSTHGRIGMLDLTKRVRDLWLTNKNEIISSADQIAETLRNAAITKIGSDLDETIFHKAFDEFEKRFDKVNGGFGSAPKFPTPHNLMFLLRYWKRFRSKPALEMAEKTLTETRKGGIFDHVGFGFHRYSTDQAWLVPHFEKMLYDQALLAAAYIEAFLSTKTQSYAKTAEEIFSYVLREMTGIEGGFFSAEDADSNGEEGKFYLWDETEINSKFTEEEASLIKTIFNLEESGNFADPVTGNKNGNNILHIKKTYTDLAADLNISEQTLREKLEIIRKKLFAERKKRAHPLKDDKILTDWNGLMISAFARGAMALEKDEYRTAAESAAVFVLTKMRTEDGRLLHRYRDGQAGLTANVDDYSFFIQALLDLYELTFKIDYLKAALELTDVLIADFWDDTGGGFYFTSGKEEHIVRQKEIYDGALPSGNSVALLNLTRLARITANPNFEKKAGDLIRTFSDIVIHSPSAFTQLLNGFDFLLGPSREIVIAGKINSPDTEAMLKAIRSKFIPNKILLFNPEEYLEAEIQAIAPYTKDQKALNGKATAYICQNFSCSLPTNNVNEMLKLLL